MKGLFSLALTLATFACSPGLDRGRSALSGDHPMRVALPVPGNVTIGNCRLEYNLIGSFGGYGGFARPKLDASEFEIETVHEGKAVERVRVVLYCSGYQVETMSFDTLPDFDGRTLRVYPKPLGTVPFRGVVRGVALQELRGFYVDVDYTPSWICEYFQRGACFLSPWRVASVELDGEGRFSAGLPHFARDAAVRSFKDPGEFALLIRDQKTGNRLFELNLAESSARGPGAVPVVESYPGEHLVYAERPK